MCALGARPFLIFLIGEDENKERLNLTNLMKCLKSSKIFIISLLVHCCMYRADQKSFS